MKALDIQVTMKVLSPWESVYEDDFKSSFTIDDVLREFGFGDEECKFITANGGLASRNDRIAKFDQHNEGRVFITFVPAVIPESDNI